MCGLGKCPHQSHMFGTVATRQGASPQTNESNNSMADAVELTRALIRFNTVNPPGNERPCAEFLGGLLEAAGYSLSYYPMGENRTNLIARIGGVSGKKPLCFSGHTDVVPLGAAPWSHEPFGGEVAGGKIYGRGSSDMKSGVAAFVSAALDLAPHLHRTPGLVLVITADEECGCVGAKYLATLGSALGEAGALIVAEPTANRPLVGHRGILRVEGVAQGVTAHGSMPEKGENAVYKAARVITRLEALNLHEGCVLKAGLPSLNVGWIQGGININSVPDEAVFGVDIRTVPGFGTAEAMDVLAQVGGTDVTFTGMTSGEPVWSDPSDPWVASVFALMAEITGEHHQPAIAPYFTDASPLTLAYGKPPTLILGPGEPAMAHQTDEFCLIRRVEEASAAFREITRRWCGI
jgi:succinyl-diaminopimelate desuccinylase